MNDINTEQSGKIAKLETDVAVLKEVTERDISALRREMKSGFKHIIEALDRLEKKTDENCKMLREDNDAYRERVDERIMALEMSVSTINVRIAKWAGIMSVLIFLLQMFGQKLVDIFSQ